MYVPESGSLTMYVPYAPALACPYVGVFSHVCPCVGVFNHVCPCVGVFNHVWSISMAAKEEWMRGLKRTNVELKLSFSPKMARLICLCSYSFIPDSLPSFIVWLLNRRGQVYTYPVAQASLNHKPQSYVYTCARETTRSFISLSQMIHWR